MDFSESFFLTANRTYMEYIIIIIIIAIFYNYTFLGVVLVVVL